MKVTIVGGGSSAHTLIGLLGGSNHEVSIYTRKPEKWGKEVDLEYVNPNGEFIRSIKGPLVKASHNKEEVISDADLIILCLPVYKYRDIIEDIFPYISNDKKVYLGTIYGQGGFNWMVEDNMSKYPEKNVSYFAIGLIPWICRTKEYGHSATTYGAKKLNYVAMNNRSEFEYLNKTFLKDICLNWFEQGEFVLADSFISITLCVDNQIIHTTRMFGLHSEFGGEWDSNDQVPFFYKDYSENSANILRDLDRDYAKIRNHIKDLYKEKDFEFMLDYLELERKSYGSSNTDIRASFVESPTLGQIKTPVVFDESKQKYVLNKDHRFFYDDIYFGLVIAKWFALEFDIAVPTIDNILQWAQNLLEVNILNDDKTAFHSDFINQTVYRSLPNKYTFTKDLYSE